jgi:hypothetical protein
LRQWCKGQSRLESSKPQTPSSRETPSLKLQTAREPRAGVWDLVLGMFLELGFWDLELSWILVVDA